MRCKQAVLKTSGPEDLSSLLMPLCDTTDPVKVSKRWDDGVSKRWDYDGSWCEEGSAGCYICFAH